ncbi:MAG: metallophosphoesterase [Nitrospirae bacterium]|nr:metallophosphoesterase [Nitrospirota bacterium]
MSTKGLRWLHLSDFHSGKDQYGQIQLFDSIIEHIDSKKKADQTPDLIFITGDIADKGKKDEYELFCNDFILPLCDLLGDTTKIFIVPGNHDVDRDEARATKRYGIVNEIPEFFDPDKKGLHERKVLFPRFENYTQADMHAWTISPDNWLFSEEGFFTYIHEKNGCKIGILGINTAWLSEGEDRHHLTPGKTVIQTGLKKLEDCAFKLIIGHHPLDWYDEDEMPIRSIFGKKSVIYIHGHLHRNSGNQEVGAGRKFLTVQSGAAFQARESERWINRLLWCELDLEKAHLNIQPLQWSKANQEWALDGIAYPEEYRKPGTDYWVLPLKDIPHKPKAQSVKTSEEDDTTILPQGWSLVDQSFLDEKQRDLSEDDILSFFDGRVPSWRDALSAKIPRRKIVSDIVAELHDARQHGELRVTLILGAGGEGKSTVFFQTISDLLTSDSRWNILWLSNPARDILWPNRFLNQLPHDTNSWLIVSDDADLVAKYLFETAKSFHRAERKDIQFLLCCRDSDWLAAEAHEWQWKDYVTFVEKRLRGITIDDAELIVKGWAQLGSKGLGKLSGLDYKEAASRLYIASKSEEEKYQDEGAFLGAMLRARMGDELKSHVKSLLLRLKERHLKNETLMDAFAYIAAMHSEQLYILTKEILAETLSCKLNDIKKKITGPLGDEAAASTGGDRIYTRHRAIAEAAVELLDEIFHVDFDEIFITLAESAYRIHCQGLYLPYFVKWKFLSDHFLSRGNTSLAIRLDQALRKIDPADSRLIVHLSRLLREAGQPDLSIKVFRELDHGLAGPVRAVFFEWGVAEGVSNNDALAVWLFGVALSDKIELKPIENKTATMCLSGLAMNLFRLFESYNNSIFIESCGAAVQIGLSFPLLNEIDRRLLGEYEAKSRAAGVEKGDLKIAFHRLQKGIISAWEQKEATLAHWVAPASELTFERLGKLIGIEDI